MRTNPPLAGKPRILDVYPLIVPYPGKTFAQKVAAFEAAAPPEARRQVWDLLGIPCGTGTLSDHLGGIETRERGDLILFTYSPELAFARAYLPGALYPTGWNRVSLLCRGLIARRLPDGSLRLLYRGMPKFFNEGEVHATERAELARLAASGYIVDKSRKMDGSLGEIYFDDADGRWHLTTRGSLDSDQGRIGEQMLYTLPHWRRALDRLDPRFCYAVEIVYPENRIVVNYGDTTELFLLRIIHRDTGYILTDRQLVAAARDLGVPTADVYEAPLEQVIAERSHLPGDADEGIVVLYSEFEVPLEQLCSGAPVRLPEQRLVKIKWAAYLEVHKAVSALLNPRAAQNAVLESIRATLGCGKPGIAPWDDFARAFPPDRLPAVEAIAAAIWDWRRARLAEAERYRDAVVAEGPFPDRRTMADTVQRLVPAMWRGPVFALLDGKSYEPLRPPCSIDDIFSSQA